MLNKIIVNSEHPAWSAIDDDDWNGATFYNWLQGLVDRDVILRPSFDHSLELINRMEKIIKSCAKSVQLENINTTMKTKYVILDKISGLYVMCWSEHNSIFLTDNYAYIEDYKSSEYSIETFQKMKTSNCTFYRDSDDVELINVDLQVGILTISTNFKSIL